MLNEVFRTLRSFHIQDQTKRGDDEKCHQDGEKFHGITVVKCHRPLAKAAARPQGQCLFALSFISDWINIHYENWIGCSYCEILPRSILWKLLSQSIYLANWSNITIIGLRPNDKTLRMLVSFTLNNFNNMNQISVQFRFEMSMEQHQTAFHQH